MKERTRGKERPQQHGRSRLWGAERRANGTRATWVGMNSRERGEHRTLGPDGRDEMMRAERAPRSRAPHPAPGRPFPNAPPAPATALAVLPRARSPCLASPLGPARLRGPRLTRRYARLREIFRSPTESLLRGGPCR